MPPYKRWPEALASFNNHTANHETAALPLAPKGMARSVRLDSVSQRYGEVLALGATSLSIAPGETVALLGPSGSGKTTLLQLLAGELRPSSGRVFIQGADVGTLKQGPALARLVGMVHQQFDLVPQLSALNNTLAGRLGQWSAPRAMLSLLWPQDRRLALEALERVGVVGRAGLRAAKLSGGEQQRVAIARLLLQDPAIILADEPVSSLDPARAEEIVRLLLEVSLSGGKTLIASLHSVTLARKHFGRLIGLRNGQVCFDLPATLVTDSMLAELYTIEGLRIG